MTRQPITRIEFVSQLLCPSLYIMVVLMVAEALLAAATTYLVIKAGRDVADDEFLVADLLWILAAQSASYVAGAVSWVFAERAGFRCYSRYMLRFARDNKDESKLLHDKAAREQAEPFLTGTTFNNVFNLMYEIEAQLKLLLGVLFNSIVLGVEIDVRLSIAYAVVFTLLMMLQWSLRGRVAYLYLDNQRQNNRVVSHGYTAWDNVFAGNRYNLRLWIAGFKTRIRDCLRAQIAAIMAREGLSAAGGIIGLTVVFATMTYVATQYAGDTATLIALAATLPRQIEMTNNVHELASGWNDVIAVWTRIGDVVDNMHPAADPHFNKRIKFDRLLLRSGDHAKVTHSVEEALRLVDAEPTGRINVRGGNGSGKSTLLAALKAEIKNRLLLADHRAPRLRLRRAGTTRRARTRRGRRGVATRRRQTPRLFIGRAPAQVSAGDRDAHRCAHLPARRMGRQSRPGQPVRRRRAGRSTGPARPRGGDFPPRPGVVQRSSNLMRGHSGARSSAKGR
jgi:ABC-type multidrug transport system fused ATPase/permease subunit